MEIGSGLKILHTTSDLIGIEKHSGYIKFTLQGDRDLAGEIVFEGEMAGKIESAAIDGGSLGLTPINSRIALNYSHKHNKEIVIKIYLAR